MNSSENGTSATEWNDVDWRRAEEEVRRLRQRIFRAEKTGNARKVRSLQKLMLRSYSNRLVSVRRVTQTNQGKNTPGIDKVIVKGPAERGRLVDSLAGYQLWKPSPARRIYIPKANGKLRPLGIPVIRDRAVQAMVKNALEPQWEARFGSNSYGFRPGRGAHDAVELAFKRLKPGTKPWVIDADIKSAFDKIDHDFLLKKIANFPARELIKQWLKAGFVEADGFFRATHEGTPQGGVISPLLANIALDGMEAVVPKGRLIIYADDFVIFCKSKNEAQEIMRLVEGWLSKRGLEFSQEKTRIVHGSEGFDFLGFNIRMYHNPGTRRMTRNPLFVNPREGKITLTRPSKNSLKKIRAKLRETVRQYQGSPQEALIGQLNPILRGWASYFSIGTSSQTYSAIDNYMWKVLWKWARREHSRKSRYWIVDRYWGRYAPGRDSKWVFGYNLSEERPVYLYSMAWTKIKRHIIVKGNHSTDDPSLTDYWAKRRMRQTEKQSAGFRKTLSLLQKGLCPLCKCDLENGEELHKHHKIPRAKGGTDHILNFQLVHLYCHQQIHATFSAGAA